MRLNLAYTLRAEFNSSNDQLVSNNVYLFSLLSK